jgi:hypothetical protein
MLEEMGKKKTEIKNISEVEGETEIEKKKENNLKSKRNY